MHKYITLYNKNIRMIDTVFGIKVRMSGFCINW